MNSMLKTNETVTDHNKHIKSGKTLAVRLNPFDPEFRANPYPFYHHLRSEDPIHRDPGFLGDWILTRYEDVRAVLHDPRFGVNSLSQLIAHKSARLQHQQVDLNALAEMTRQWFLFQNPPNHTRLRKLVSKAFSVRTMNRMRSQVQEIVDGIIDQVQNAEVVDIIADVAEPLPVTVISRMLGVPDEDHTRLKMWARDLARVFGTLMLLEDYVHINQVAQEFMAYFRDLIAERKKRPTTGLINDLIAITEQDNLTEDEVLGFCILLFLAGEETSEYLIGNGILALLQHPDQLERLKQQPTLIERAVEELLRYESPTQFSGRIAGEDIEMGGKTIQAGDRVIVSLGAANRDPAQFLNPDQLDITRNPNRHLAFGFGMHHCLGAALARIEGQIAINTLIRRLPHMKLSTSTPKWRKQVAGRGLKSLEVTFRTPSAIHKI